VLAPRFINLPVWTTQRQAAKFSPLMIYKPAPQTWQMWENGAALLAKAVSQNQQTQSIAPITLEWIRSLHFAATNGLVQGSGSFRTHNILGGMNSVEYAISKQHQAQLLIGGGYHRPTDPQSPVFKWTPTTCSTIEGELVDIDINKFFFMPSGEPKQCGFVTYLDYNEIPSALLQWATSINQATQAWRTHPTAAEDPLLVAARAQRWFVSIHPFNDGNGRISRYIMDLLITSLGLPAPLLANMDHDIYTPESKWADEIANGIMKTIRVMERCAVNSKIDGCNVVSEVAEPNQYAGDSK